MDRLSLLKEFLDEQDIWSRVCVNYAFHNENLYLRLDALKMSLSFAENGDLWMEKPQNSWHIIGNIANPDFFQKILQVVGS